MGQHIHGNDGLRDKILSLRQGEIIQLEIDGWLGSWVKMDNGKDGRPTMVSKRSGRHAKNGTL